MKTINKLAAQTFSATPLTHPVWALLLGLALSGAVVHAAALTEADIIQQLQAVAAANLQAVDPDDVFANGEAVSKNLGRIRPPDTDGACLEEQAPGAGHKALVVIPLAPAGAPQVNLTLQFASGKYQLTKADEQQLNTMAVALNSVQLNKAKFTLSGHTDDVGQVLINQKLSCARALSARTYLIAAGVAENRLSAYGFGSSRPIPGSAANLSANRRVEFRRAANQEN
jgi:outer membrane protein OmpA-like peptidoglycan-associated protein